MAIWWYVWVVNREAVPAKSEVGAHINKKRIGDTAYVLLVKSVDTLMNLESPSKFAQMCKTQSL